MQLPTVDEVDAHLAKASLREFVRMAWPLAEPGREFVPNWHVDAICEHLEAVTSGEIRKLLINVPPRGMKSLLVSVFWPCWEWLSDPKVRWLFASYGEKLATRDALKARRLLQSEGVRMLPGEETERTLLERVGYRGLLRLLGEDWELTADQNVKTRYENDRTGYRISASFGGSVTGDGGDRRVLDDPHKPDEITSDVVREDDLDWYDQTWSSRGMNPKTDTEVLIMQRLHELDLTGHVLEQGGWEHICLPAEYEPNHPCVWPKDPRSEAGELLWPDRLTREHLDEQRGKGSYYYAGQYQQRPSPEEGGYFKRRWWRYYDHRHPPGFRLLLQSWDTAFKDKLTSDFVVGQLWGVDLANRYLIRQVRGRWDVVETKAQIRAMCDWAAQEFPDLKGHAVLVENAATGPEVVAELRNEVHGVVAVKPKGDKVQRALAVTPQIEAGQVFLPGRAAPDGLGPDTALTPGWVQELIEECAGFPLSPNDDQVDALSQALIRLAGSPGGAIRSGGKTLTGGMRANF